MGGAQCGGGEFFPDGAELQNGLMIFVARQCLLGANLVIQRDDSATPAEQLDFDGIRTNALEVANSQDVAQEINGPKIGAEVQVVKFGVGSRIIEKGKLRAGKPVDRM